MRKARLRLLTGTALAVLLHAHARAQGPQGGTVVAGAAQITTSGPATRIDQTSHIAVIDWTAFNIARGESVTFVQPGTSATAVNRIGGHAPSTILGDLNANGRVVLINGDGFLFGNGARINTGAFIATTRDASNADIMAGKANFSGGRGRIVNQGTITANSGEIGLLAGAVNNSGVLRATLDKVVLGDETLFTLDFTGDGLISFPLEGGALASLGPDGSLAAITNSGRIEGAQVLISARAAAALTTGVVSTGDIVTATAAGADGGSIVLDGGAATTQVSGLLDAASASGAGGRIEISGDGGIVLSDAHLTAAGARGGGRIRVGGWTAASLDVTSGTVLDVSATAAGDGAPPRSSRTTPASPA